jgi:hypothetical protein
MTILSLEEIFSDAQAITGTANSTNVIDFGAPGRWIHSDYDIVDEKGNSCIPLFIQCVEDFDNLTSLTIALEKDDNAAFGSATTVYSESRTLAQLVAGDKPAIRMIPWKTDEQYLRITYTVVGSAPTVGKMTAGIGCGDNPWGNR